MNGTTTPELDDLFAAGWEALQTERVSEAQEAFLAVLAGNPEHVDALNGLGTAFFHEKRLDDAGAMHAKALGLLLGSSGGAMPASADWGDPDGRRLLRALHGLALVAYRRGELKDATARFEQLLKLNPRDNTGAAFLLADIRRGRTRWDQIDPHGGS